MIKVENVTKTFEKLDEHKKKFKFNADNDISFEVHEGEIVGLLGPNGAGKTTLLRIIAGIMKPTEGAVSIDDMTYDKNDLEIKKNMSFLSGNTKLYKELSPYELMEMCGEFYNVDKKTLYKRIDEIIKRFDMKKFKNQRIDTLSTGQTQRVGIARCLVHNPKYYVFDEATSGLDIISSKVILDFIKEEKKNGKGVIYSTHYMEEAENLSDRIGIMANGSLVEIGTAEALIKKTKAKNFEDAFVTIATGGEL